MTRESTVSLPIVTSADGSRCAWECTALNVTYASCCAFDIELHTDNAGWVRHPACIAAEQAAASVPSCEGARGLDASEALREARVHGMREALATMRTILKEDAWGTPYIDLDDAEEALDVAIEAVRKGKR